MISKLIASQKFKRAEFCPKLADSNVVKILSTKTLQMSYLCYLIWHDFSQGKFLEKFANEW